MHVDEYEVVEKKGTLLAVGEGGGGRTVVLFASLTKESVSIVSNDEYVVASTSSPDVVLSSLEAGKDEKEILSTMEAPCAFAYVSKKDFSSVVSRKNGGKSEVWHYSRFPGFGHIVDAEGEGDPEVIDWSSDFPTFSTSLWNALQPYGVMEIEMDGGRRIFSR
ncbi:MAG: hypothetical protein ACI4S4_04325 [Candidatus Ornithospirochaeta sp.]